MLNKSTIATILGVATLGLMKSNGDSTSVGSKAIHQKSFKFSGTLRNGITYEGQVWNASAIAIKLYSKDSDQEKSPNLFIKKDGRMDEYDYDFRNSDLIGDFNFGMANPRVFGEWGDPSFCTDPIIRLEEKFGEHPFLFEDYGYLQSGFRGYGIAKQVYNLILELISKSSKKPFYFCPDTCKEGATSEDMMRVWKSLSKKYINEALNPTWGIWVLYVRPEDFHEVTEQHFTMQGIPILNVDAAPFNFGLTQDDRMGIQFAKTFNIDTPSGSANKPKRKKKFIVRSPQQGLKVIQHKDITDNWKKSLKVRPKHRVAVLLPCAATKPFAESPSHKYGYLKALGDKDVDLYVVSEPLGIIPYAWQDKYPNADYDYPPKYLKGKARDLLSERIGEWFKKVYPKYDKVYSALPAHHQKLVNDSTNATLEEVTINQCRQDTCSDNVFRATSGEYVRYLRRQVK